MGRITRSRTGSVAACAMGCVLWLGLALQLLGPIDSSAQSAPAPVSERSVKAAFLYQFASYVEWPDSARIGDAPLVIGVLGDDDFADELTATTAGRTVAKRPIVVSRVEEESLPEDGLDVLFVSDARRGSLRRVLAETGRRPVLTVTESRGAIDDGAIINFVVEAERVRFEVSTYAAELKNLRLNARLLNVAQRVHQSPE